MGNTSGCLPGVNMHSLMDEPPSIEGMGVEELPVGSLYRRFWDGCRWSVFLVDRQNSDGEVGVVAVAESQAGVYEFGISLASGSGVIVPVYVGESKCVRNRFGQYKRDGSSLAVFFEEYLSQGYTVWSRVRYLEDKNQAERWESRWLISYDYAWNTKLNIGPRKLSLEEHSCCCCMFGVHAFDETKKEGSLILSSPFRATVWYINTVSFMMQIILYITVLAIVVDQLDVSAQSGPVQQNQCLLDPDPNNMSLCLYVYAMAGIGMFFTLVCSAVMSFYMVQKRYKRTVGIVSMAFMVLFSIIASIVITSSMVKADDQGIPKESWRDAVAILLWCILASWCIPLVTSTVFQLTRATLGLFARSSSKG
eukprot:jgi/Picsp_1/3015/NSC_01237-R1_transcripteion factor